MSEGVRIPLDSARRTAAWLMDRWGLDPAACAVLGSIRRGLPTVGDIELLAPHPGDGNADPLHDAIAASLGLPASSLFPGDDTGAASKPVKRVKGTVVKGLKPGFKLAQVMIRNGDGDEIKVDLWRYTPGASGNRGWIEVIRTGSEEFSQAVAAEWMRVSGTPKDHKGSDKGFMLRWSGPIAGGQRTWIRMATPTEMDVFRLIRCVFAPPEKRETGAALLGIDWFGDRAKEHRAKAGMKALGYACWDDVMQYWDVMTGLKVMEPEEAT